jgi:uncharacterized protein (TIGR00162 family)
LQKTEIVEVVRADLKNPILVEGLPGLGMVGRIAVRYLAKSLGAERLAFLYSPHFPYYVVVSKKGDARLLRGEFRFWRNTKGDGDVVFLSGDSQAQTIEGQYEVADTILEFAKAHGVRTIVSLGGFRVETENTPKVIAAATSGVLLDKAVAAGAIVSGAGNPVVGTAGLLLGMAHFKHVEALCLLSETRGYLPDPRSAKSMLAVLVKLLDMDIDLAGLDKEIAKAEQIVAKMQQIEERREQQVQKMREQEEGRVKYIS